MRLRTLAWLIVVVACTSCGSDDDDDQVVTPDAAAIDAATAPDAPLDVAPVIAGLVATPTTVVAGVSTEVTWTWTYANTPAPTPACTIDQGVGEVASGSATSVTLSADTTFTLSCTNAAGGDTEQVTVLAVPASAPQIATFVATPAAVVTGVATDVTWTWTYANTPAPEPACSINQGVGPVISGQTTSLTLASNTTFMLTCTSSEGSSTKSLVVTSAVAPVAPVIATFVATPASVTMNAPTSVVWTWTYANSPTPAPSCTIDQGIGAVTIGASRTVTLAADTPFTLSCSNTAGSDTEQRTITVTAPVAPVIATFTASPPSVTAGVPTSVTFAWSYANSPSPEPSCSLDQGIGTITSGGSRTVTLSVATVYTLTCSNSGGGDTEQLTITTTPPVAPVIATFAATPSFVKSGTLSFVAWTFTFANNPSPAPSCSIDQGVGGVTSGQVTGVNLTMSRTYTLTCTNTGGNDTEQTTIQIAVPPVIGSFTATPQVLTVGAATTVTWTFSFSNSPAPAPTCSIEHGVGAVTSGQTSSITLAQARTYRLTCSNVGGAAKADATVSVDECAANVDDCDVHATCVDTVESFTCACNAGYTGDGRTCGVLAACNVTPGVCDPDATCSNTIDGFACECNDGHVGDGAACQRLRLAFVTSTTGNANLSTWSDAGGLTGLAAADAVCQSRAAAGGLPGTYVAWLSDASTDAYCRVHGLSGKKASNCGQASLPVTAGPWARVDGLPFAPRIDRLLAPNLTLYYPAAIDEFGVTGAITDQVWSATDSAGVFKPTFATSAPPCANWTSEAGDTKAVTGRVHGSGVAWTEAKSDPACSALEHLRCIEVGVGSGPPLPPQHPGAKRVFLTSTSGNGNLSTWADAGGSTGIAAADAVCRARARSAGFTNAPSFKAWMSTSASSAASRITSAGPWARLDGVVIADDRTDLLDGSVRAAIILTEAGSYFAGAGTLFFNFLWTGTLVTGLPSSSNCGNWTTAGNSIFGGVGQLEMVNTSWTGYGASSCNAVQRMFCFED